MAAQHQCDILEAAQTPDGKLYQEHVEGFVNNFVVKARRERWLNFLVKRPERIYGESHKLYDALDRTKCSLVKDQSNLNKLKGEGVYYEFFDEPKILRIQDALVVGPDRDALFLLVPGKLALFFFHESEIWLCQA